MFRFDSWFLRRENKPKDEKVQLADIIPAEAVSEGLEFFKLACEQRGGQNPRLLEGAVKRVYPNRPKIARYYIRTAYEDGKSGETVRGIVTVYVNMRTKKTTSLIEYGREEGISFLYRPKFD